MVLTISKLLLGLMNIYLVMASSTLFKFKTNKYLASSWTPTSSLTNVLSYGQCSSKCSTTNGCSAFTYDSNAKVCEFGNKNQLQVASPGLPDNQIKEIVVNPDEPWLMTMGGYDGVNTKTEVVLFNWQTGQLCWLPGMPIPVGGISSAFFNGVPLFCGGHYYGQSPSCYKYMKNTKVWTQIASLQNGIQFSSAVIVPNRGLYMFGGNSLTQPQFLASVNGTWAKGPMNLYQSSSVYGVCTIQLSDTVTAFFGGSNDNYAIITFDWTTMTYKLQNSKLIQPRVASTCAFIKKRKGPRLVAIAGSDVSSGRGLEAWNPVDDTIQLLVREMPQEMGSPIALYRVRMASVDDNTKLIMFYGKASTHLTDIWSYDYENETWKKVGNILAGSSEVGLTPVSGIDCS